MSTVFLNFPPDKTVRIGHKLKSGASGRRLFSIWNSGPMTSPDDIVTPRLRMKPLTHALAIKQASDAEAFFDALGVAFEASWPPELMDQAAMEWTRDQLAAHPDEAGWHQWVFISPVMNRLVGSGGFKGAPGPDGTVEIGYAMLTSYREQGLATEAVLGLLSWAYRQPGVKRIIAHTMEDGAASRRVLEKSGFVETDALTDDATGKPVVAYEHRQDAEAA